MRDEAVDDENADEEDAHRLHRRPHEKPHADRPQRRFQQIAVHFLVVFVLEFLRIVRLDDADARQKLVNLRAHDRTALHGPLGPLADLLADEDDREHEHREAHDDERERDEHVVDDREIDDEPDRDENLERRARQLGERDLDDLLDLRRIPRRARHEHPHIDAPEELEGLFLDMLQQLDAHVGDDLGPRPREAVLVEEDEPEPDERHERDDDDRQKRQCAPDRPVLARERNAQFLRKLLRFRIPGRQVGGRRLHPLGNRQIGRGGLRGAFVLRGEFRLHVLHDAHFLQRRLHRLEERHERPRRQHAAHDPHHNPEAIALGGPPEPSVRLARRIFAVEEFLLIINHTPPLYHILAL